MSSENLEAVLGENRLPTLGERQKYNIHLVYPDPEDGKNEEIAPSLRQLENKGANVVVVSSGHLLSPYEETPFIRPPSGKSVWGVGGIRDYVRNYKDRPELG